MVNMEQMKVTPSVIVMSYGLIPFSRILKNILREDGYHEDFWRIFIILIAISYR